MAVSFINSIRTNPNGSGYADHNQVIQALKPSGIQTGDLLIVASTHTYNDGFGNYAIVAPVESGWTLIVDNCAAGTYSPYVRVWARYAAANDPATFGFKPTTNTASGRAVGFQLVSFAYRGAVLPSATNVSATTRDDSVAASTGWSTLSEDVSIDGSMAVHLFSIGYFPTGNTSGYDKTWSTPAGTTERFDGQLYYAAGGGNYLTTNLAWFDVAAAPPTTPARTSVLNDASQLGYDGTVATIILTQANVPPTVNITTPTENQKLDPRLAHNVAWTYSDTEGDVQTSYSAVVKEPAPAPTSYPGGSAAQTGSAQTYTVPVTGMYTIEAIGAAGGQSSDSMSGGKGARVIGDFNLTAGQVLTIIPGKQGLKPTGGSRGGGGGGASWVYIAGSAQPLIVAGGGGGAGNYAYNSAVQDASLTTDGKAGTVGTYGAGGTGGNGGGASTYASGGAGWLTDGTNNGSGYSTGGKKPANGATGGNGYSVPSEGNHGGFGGGGGSYAGAGGGAGYSGGGGGGWSNSGHGGGGGSYNAGTNQVNTAGVGTGEGSVNISMDGATVYTTSGTTATSFTIPANSMIDENDFAIELTVNNANGSTTTTRTVLADSWNYGNEVTTATQSANFSTTGLVHGKTYDIQVATSDAEGFGPWSSTASFINNFIPSAELATPIVFTGTAGKAQWNYSDRDGDNPIKFQIRYRKRT